MPKRLKDQPTQEERAELDQQHAAHEAARKAAQDLLLQTGWAKLQQAHAELKKAGRIMILFGVRALQLKAALPYGEFNRQLALQCPQISRSQAYRGMQVTLHLMEEVLLVPHRGTTGEALEEQLAAMADALTGTGNAAMAEVLDDLIEGKSGRQLVLEVRRPKKECDTKTERDAKENCLTFFEHDPRGPAMEATLRWQAEAGEMSWGEVWRDCTAVSNKRTDLTEPPDPKKLKDILRIGLHRLNAWADPKGWEIIAEADRPALLESWAALLDNLNPDFRVVALRKLKGGKP